MNNGIMIIEPIDGSEVTHRDVFGALIIAAGGSVSNMPEEVEGNIAFSDKWEFFDPAKVTEPDVLPDYWAAVYQLHNAPNRTDCVDLGYRYVHVPVDILPDYPRVPCKGIFCVSCDSVLIEAMTANDLIHIGNEVCEEMEGADNAKNLPRDNNSR